MLDNVVRKSKKTTLFLKKQSVAVGHACRASSAEGRCGGAPHICGSSFPAQNRAKTDSTTRFLDAVGPPEWL